MLAAVTVATLGCQKPLETDECERLLDRYTELLLRNENPEVTAQVIAVKQTEARALAKSEPAFEWVRCADAVSRVQFDCAMRAGSVDDVERCLSL